jgi:hypothetical protein
MSMTATSPIFVLGPNDRRVRRRGRTVVGIVLMSLALTLGIQRVVIAAPRSSEGALLVQGEDRNGHASSSADVIKVSGAYPGMAAQTSTFEVRNTGTLPVAFSLNSKGVVASGGGSLDDVLRITVRDPATGAMVYRGRLSSLHIEHTGVLQAGARATFTVDVTWPITATDGMYQGAGLHFSIMASPAAA